MKKVLTLIAMAAMVLVACNTKKPSAETVSAEAQKAANALVTAIASGDDAAIKEAVAAKQAVMRNSMPSSTMHSMSPSRTMVSMKKKSTLSSSSAESNFPLSRRLQ